jgi:hypothetical protein
MGSVSLINGHIDETDESPDDVFNEEEREEDYVDGQRVN